MSKTTAKMKRCTAGEHIPRKRALEIVASMLETDAPDEFVSGVEFACAFLSCRKDDTRYGMDPAEFYAEGTIEGPSAAVVSQAVEIITKLESMGVSVVDAYIKKAGN